MFDELWSEIADAPGEIFDVIEYKEEWEKEEKFNVESYINGNYDYWHSHMEILAILIPGAIVIGAPFLIAKALKIKLFTDTNSYDDGFIDGYILGENDD